MNFSGYLANELAKAIAQTPELYTLKRVNEAVIAAIKAEKENNVAALNDHIRVLDGQIRTLEVELAACRRENDSKSQMIKMMSDNGIIIFEDSGTYWCFAKNRKFYRQKYNAAKWVEHQGPLNPEQWLAVYPLDRRLTSAEVYELVSKYSLPE